MTGTVLHKFDDKKTCFNMLTHNEQPFSASEFYGSSWLEKTDAHLRSARREKPGFYTMEQIQDALHASLGNYADHVEMLPNTRLSLLLLVSNESGAATEIGSRGVVSDFSRFGHQTCKEVVLDDTLLRWVVTNSVAGDKQLSVVSCLPSDERFAQLLKEIRNESSRGVQLDNHAVLLSDWRMTASNMLMKGNHLGGPGSGFLYAFHAVYSGGHSRLPPAETDFVTEREEDHRLGPVLSKISPRTIKAHGAKSTKLSSILFCGDITDDIDEDIIINSSKQFDTELLRIVERPASRSFPKITTDGSCVLAVDAKDCAAVLERMKKAVADPMTVSNTGSFVARYIDQCQSAPAVEAHNMASSRDSAICMRVASSMFDCEASGKQNALTMTPRAKALYAALKKQILLTNSYQKSDTKAL